MYPPREFETDVSAKESVVDEPVAVTRKDCVVQFVSARSVPSAVRSATKAPFHLTRTLLSATPGRAE